MKREFFSDVDEGGKSRLTTDVTTSSYNQIIYLGQLRKSSGLGDTVSRKREDDSATRNRAETSKSVQSK